jgi:hypothetical protein
MGVEFQAMQTALTVEQALEMLGLRVTRPGTKKGAASAGSEQARDRSDRFVEDTQADTRDARDMGDAFRGGEGDGGWSSGGGVNGEASRLRRR